MQEKLCAVTKGVKQEGGRILQAHQHVYHNMYDALHDNTQSDDEQTENNKTIPTDRDHNQAPTSIKHATNNANRLEEK